MIYAIVCQHMEPSQCPCVEATLSTSDCPWLKEEFGAHVSPIVEIWKIPPEVVLSISAECRPVMVGNDNG